MAKKESGGGQAEAKTEVQGVDSVLKEGAANYFRGFSSVGGKLHLTARHLIFKPHMLNWRRGDDSFALKDVVAVKKQNTAIVVPNGFSLVMRDGSEARFAVYGRDEWVQAVVDCTAIHPPRKPPAEKASHACATLATI
jgi:hypothetical protein